MEVNRTSTFAIYRLTIMTVLLTLTLMFVSATAIEPSSMLQTDSCINSLIDVGNYSGCTKKCSKIENNKNTLITLNHMLEFTLLFTIITVYILPVLVLLPMGGECTNAGGARPQNHKDTCTSTVTTSKQNRKQK